jgi:hypothetical protein
MMDIRTFCCIGESQSVYSNCFDTTSINERLMDERLMDEKLFSREHRALYDTSTKLLLPTAKETYLSVTVLHLQLFSVMCEFERRLHFSCPIPRSVPSPLLPRSQQLSTVMALMPPEYSQHVPTRAAMGLVEQV